MLAEHAITSQGGWYASLPSWEKEAVLIVFGGDRKAAYDAHMRFQDHLLHKEKKW